MSGKSHNFYDINNYHDEKLCFPDIIMFFLISGVLSSQDRQAAFEMNCRLGRGINIGNTFDAPSETAWSNPWDPEYCRIISDLGFCHIRVPVRWETAERTMEVPPYTIETAFLERIRSVVDTALKHNLHVKREEWFFSL